MQISYQQGGIHRLDWHLPKCSGGKSKRGERREVAMIKTGVKRRQALGCHRLVCGSDFEP